MSSDAVSQQIDFPTVSSENSFRSSVKPQLSEDVSAEPTGTVFSEWSVIANTMIGTGVLGLASAFTATGWILGFCLMTVSALMAVFALHLMNSLSMSSTTRQVSWYTVSGLYCPWAKLVVDIVVIIKCAGVAVSYLQVAGDMLSMLLVFWSGTEFSESTVRSLIIVAATILMAPTCMAKELKSTTLVNVLALVTITYCVILGCVYSDADGGDDTVGIPPQSSFTNILAKLPVFIFAFTCHENMFPCATDMKGRTQKKLDFVAVSAELTGFMIFLPAVICPYLTFGSQVQPNYLQNIDYKNNIPVQVGYIALSIGVLCSYALQVVPIVRSAMVLVTRGKTISSPRKANAIFYIVAAVCQLVPMALAIAVHSLGVTFSFVGIVGSNTIAYIMPSFLYCMMVRKTGSKKNITFYLAVVLCVVSICLLPLCIGSLIQQIIAGTV
ncbi:10 transmembrane domain, possible aa transporter, putative [Perkinsus marinus ATCC 50983]|uniref:10 transmembrane domain, possible aa transporter, putative n=1 Tax=Perkinsus marinus (strain ATCC 50983 / TXsc) TaxID=423536 RepID=C5LU07_PERM5|nr:10 transmembrane domain, possible aa transporter, putative [Perkinsus marinus ATCC 50983]EEQ99805.1 10 transmembrane domain, possible aa transporter, putative [Perkinsus marinus ATCC 50983]|eukprot:XP_002767088.1 10 transmembrane domain, possible aa transporter, putative [Perkinsus marinus ATCC 50983]